MLRKRMFSGILRSQRRHLIITHLVSHLVVRLKISP